MTIEIFAFPKSPRAFKVMAVANHLGLDWSLRVLDGTKGDHRSPDYSALNPNQRMPTLKHGDYVLWESNAILQYLALQKPDAGLLPTDDRGRLDVTRWQFWDAAHWDASCVPFIFERVVKPIFDANAKEDAGKIAEATDAFHRSARVLNAHLGGRRYITGDALTIADFGLAAPMTLAGPARFPLEPYLEINRWFDGVRSLPAWQQTLAMQAEPKAE